MILSFKEPYLSMLDFPAIELPKFTLVTGVNGVGKTHFLEALQHGRITSSSAPNFQSDIRLFNWNNMASNDHGEFHGQSLVDYRRQLYNYFIGAFNAHINRFHSVVQSLGLNPLATRKVREVVNFSIEDLTLLLGDVQKAEAARKKIQEVAADLSQRILANIANGDPKSDIEMLCRKQGLSVIELAEEDFSIVSMPAWGRADAFQQSFAQIFVAYRDLKLDNLLAQLVAQKGDKAVKALSDHEFIDRYNIPPWDFVNKAMLAANLDFEISAPPELGRGSFEPILTKRSNNAAVKFSQLSSGEKILMSFALALYYAEDSRQIATYPKLLLLDEIDAPLHPSMSRSLLNVIIETLIGKRDVSVIATTHSPSTVALAPENSIFEMQAGGLGLRKISKGKALDILTEGVPTISISFEGRRQVFVESPIDAEVLGSVYQTLKPQLNSERSLEFIATGQKSKATGTHLNTGCDNVRHIVEALAASGNATVFGLIDWDNSNQPSSRVHVLAHGKRDGLENILLDPLLVTTLIAREARPLLIDLGLAPEITYPDFLKLTPEALQIIADGVQGLISPTKSEERVEVLYVGNFSLQIRKSFLTMDDHALDNLVVKSIPALGRISKGRMGVLAPYIANVIVPENPNFIPFDMMHSMSALLSATTHQDT